MARGELQTIQGLDLPELEKTGGKIHFYSKLDANEFLTILGSMNESGDAIDPQAWPDIIIMLARDESGKRLWGKPHREKLLKWDAVELLKVIEGISPAFTQLAERMGKN